MCRYLVTLVVEWYVHMSRCEGIMLIRRDVRGIRVRVRIPLRRRWGGVDGRLVSGGMYLYQSWLALLRLSGDG